MLGPSYGDIHAALVDQESETAFKWGWWVRAHTADNYDFLLSSLKCIDRIHLNYLDQSDLGVYWSQPVTNKVLDEPNLSFVRGDDTNAVLEKLEGLACKSGVKKLQQIQDEHSFIFVGLRHLILWFLRIELVEKYQRFKNLSERGKEGV